MGKFKQQHIDQLNAAVTLRLSAAVSDKEKQPVEVDQKNNAVYGIVLCQVGEAKGHDMHLDEQFIQNVVKFCNEAEHGLKCRLGHPNECGGDDPIHTFVGTIENARFKDGRAIADLYLSEAAKKSPKGDLHNYVLSLAKEHPKQFGMSIVFRYDGVSLSSPDGKPVEMHPEDKKKDEWTEDARWVDADGNEFDYYQLIQTPNITELNACDVVDSPAATTGLFSAFTIGSLAAQATLLFEAHPEVLVFLDKTPRLMAYLQKLVPGSKQFFNQFNKPNKPAMKGKQPVVKLSSAAIAARKRLGKDKRFDINATTDEGDIIIKTDGTEPAAGDAVTLPDGTPAADGNYVITGGDHDGGVVVVSDGQVQEYQPPTEEMDDDPDNVPPAVAEQLSALRLEIAALKGQPLDSSPPLVPFQDGGVTYPTLVGVGDTAAKEIYDRTNPKN
jgi:hypothetical protein